MSSCGNYDPIKTNTMFLVIKDELAKRGWTLEDNFYFDLETTAMNVYGKHPNGERITQEEAMEFYDALEKRLTGKEGSR